MFVVVSIFLAVWGYNSLKQNKKPALDVLTLMPDSCIIYAATKNFHELSTKLISQNLIFKAWTGVDEIKAFSEKVSFYDSILYSEPLIEELCTSNNVHFATYFTNNKMQWLCAIKLKELKQEEDIILFCKQKFKNKSENLFQLLSGDYVTIAGGILLIGNEEEIIAKAINKQNGLNKNKGFIKCLSNCSDNDAVKIYANHVLMEKHKTKMPFNSNLLLNAFESCSAVKFGPNELVLNGNYTTKENIEQKFIESQKPQSIDVYDKLPFSTSYFKIYAVSNSERLLNVIKLNSEKAEEFSAAWKELNQQALFNLDNQFFGNISNYLGELETGRTNALIIGVKDTLVCNENLKYLSASDTLIGTIKLHEIKSKINIENLFGFFLQGTYTNAFVFNDNLYFVSNKQSAIELIQTFQVNSVLSNNSSFMDYANENINTSASYISFVAPNINPEKVKKFANISLTSNKSVFENLTHASIVNEFSEGLSKYRMHLLYQSPETQTTPNLLWQCALDSLLIGKPYLFTNHNTSEKELAVQDNNNQLYLISSTGNVIWKKKLNEQVRSEIFTVDIFKNKKFQLFFNTDNYLHLIDRNGKYVEGYPVKLPSKASNQLSLVDYDNDNNVRAFIACENNFIYNYTLYGIKADGYKPYKATAKVKLPVKFIRVGASDYLITMDEEGSLHAFSRKGDGRIGFRNKTIQNCKDFLLLGANSINNTHLFYFDETNSLVNKISFADKKDVRKLSGSNENSTYSFGYFNDDKTPDVALVSEKGLAIYDVNGFSIYNNDNFITTTPCKTDAVNSKIIYYGYNEVKKSILIANNTTSTVDQIPSDSEAAIFNLFNNEKKYIVYSYNSKLYCRLLK